MSGKELLERVVAKYSSRASYTDVGYAGPDTQPMPFKTYFVRPGKFRFEWVDNYRRAAGRLHVIWSDGKNAYKFYEGQSGESACVNLNMAIAGATGISQGAAHKVSTLLMPELTGRSLAKLDRVELMEDEDVLGMRCHHIRSEDKPDCWTDIWISTSDLTVRKIKEDFKTGGAEAVRGLEKILEEHPEVSEEDRKNLLQARDGMREESRLVNVYVYEEVVFDGVVDEEVFRFNPS